MSRLNALPELWAGVKRAAKRTSDQPITILDQLSVNPDDSHRAIHKILVI
jgi:hypothetical protein